MNASSPLRDSTAIGPLPAGHPRIKSKKVGVLLVNLGTPDGTSFKPMRRYLREFLSDKRVIEWPRAAWYPILYGIVLNTRPKKSGHAYEQIWNHERNESPLRTFTRAQGEKLAIRMAEETEVVVDWAMRYGQPSIAERMDALIEQGCDRILCFPLYPQYAASTTATVNDKFFEHLISKRWMPAARTVPAYHDDPVYIDALAYTDKTMEALAKEGVKRIAVLNPGFVSDCLETLEEIAGEAGEIFLHNGGEKFSHIPCLNDSEPGMDVIEHLVRRELRGWVE